VYHQLEMKTKQWCFAQIWCVFLNCFEDVENKIVQLP